LTTAGAGPHRPVLLDEALEALRPRPDGLYVDATYGRGGHAGAIVERLGEHGRLLVLDRDPQAVDDARRRFAADPRVDVVADRFSRLQTHVAERGWTGKLAGVLFDLGVSSPQLDDGERGFSFLRDGPLDMRMDPGSGPTAADWLAAVGERDLAQVLWRYGEERYARRVAAAIVRARGERAIRRTAELAEIVAAAVPSREPGKHPATRSFQAIRIHLNAEIRELELGLAAAVASLAPGGRLVVISFHSLEDRLVKRFIRAEAHGSRVPRKLPVPGTAGEGRLRSLGKRIRPAGTEAAENPRARSATLRAAERLP
jgi:16S rRNA (cytosine1402-N4)-methyltransferase